MLDLRRLSSLGEALRDATLTFNSNVALIEANRHRESARYDYSELRREAERSSLLMRARGLAPGERCAIVMSNQSRWLISALGAFWAGSVLVPIDYKLTAAEQAALLRHCAPRCLVVDAPSWRALVAEELPEDLVVFVTEAPESADLGCAERWEQTRPMEGFSLVARARDDVACIVYSSGTGGTPKGCLLTHANYLSQAEVLGRSFPMNEEDHYFSILPTNHAIDFMCGFVLPLLFGARVVHQRTLRPEFLAATMRRYGVSHMALVPMVLKALERRIREGLEGRPAWQRALIDGLSELNAGLTVKGPRHGVSRRLLSPIHKQFGGRLRYLFCGGAFVDRGAAEFFYRLGIPVVIGYGLTEAGTVVTLNDLSPFRADSVGLPVAGTDVELRDVNVAGVGEVWVRGPTVMKGYLDAPKLTAETIVDGWLRTGDLGLFDVSGHLKLVGRVKNMIVTEGGKNVYPEDVELSFEELEGCAESCVFAADYLWPRDEGLGAEQLTIVVRPDAEGSLDALLLELRSRNRRLADYKRLSSVILWPLDFPRTASMKVKRGDLARRVAAELDRDVALQEL